MAYECGFNPFDDARSRLGWKVRRPVAREREGKEWKMKREEREEKEEREEREEREVEGRGGQRRTEERKQREGRHKMALASRVNREKG